MQHNPALPARGLGRLIPGRSKAATRDAAATTKRNRIAFGLASVLTLAASYFGIIKPENTRLQETRAQAEQAEATVTQLRAQLAHLQDLEKRAVQLGEQAVRLDEALPVETHLAKFILQVQEASNQAKLDWVSATPSPPVASGAAPGLMEASVIMTASGNYAAIQDLLSRLENLQRAVKIGSISLSAEGESTGGPNAKLNASINLKMFVAPSLPPLPPAEAAAPPPAVPAPAPDAPPANSSALGPAAGTG